MRYILAIVILLTMQFGLSGCASIASGWKSLISGSSQPTNAVAQNSQTSFNKQQNLLPPTHREYKRTTRKTLEAAAQVDPRSGSLWVMEGQGSYLFSQNVVRMVGDSISVRVEGDPLEQLKQKATVISDLLKQFEDRKMRGQMLANEKNKSGSGKDADGADPKEKSGLAAQGEQGRTPASDKSNFSVKSVPTRVVERLVDGNYRVRGAQPFMIGNREYRVIVSGVVRAEDFNDGGISADQLLDSNFDIVTSRSSEVR
jgi:flagellar L-ring protein precursor FlgH